MALPPWLMRRIIPVMRRVLCCLILFGASVLGQSGREEKSAACKKLQPILTALKSPGASRPSLTTQLADAMMSLTSSDRQPSRSTVVSFADELTGALIGKDLKDQPGVLQQSICEVLSGSTTNFKSATRFREALTALRIDSMKKQTLTTRFMAIGEEVRGPDDSPVLPVPKR